MMKSAQTVYRIRLLLFFTVVALVASCCTSSHAESSILLYSLISWGQLQGNVTFSWGGPGTNVTVEVALEPLGRAKSSEPEEYDWAIHEFPVRYDRPKRCQLASLGKKLVDLSAILGKLTLPTSSPLRLQTSELTIIGEGTIWGKSIRISGKKSACGGIHGVGGEHTYEARFYSPVGGSIWFRTWSWHLSHPLISSEEGASNSEEESGTQMTILSDVFNTFDDKPTSSSHEWNIYVTDILDDEGKGFRSSCNFLTTRYDFTTQNACQGGVCSFGSLTEKFGKLAIASVRSQVSTKSYHASSLPLMDLSGPRQLYVGIEDAVLTNNVWACARLRLIPHKKVQALFNDDGISGNISIQQSSVFNPTELTLDLQGLRKEAGGFHVHELPVKRPILPGKSMCGPAAGHYNPYKVNPDLSPEEGTGAHDEYELGDLSGKHGLLVGLESISATVIDHNLPLFGARSVVGRSIVIHKSKDGSRWVCGNLRLERPLLRAVALFRYPLVGEVVMEQDAEDPFSETSMFVGPLLYSDGSYNDTSDHDWSINLNIPNKDFYNWTMRCVSAGPHYNPYRVATERVVYRTCNQDTVERCEMGDLSRRQGPLSIAGSLGSADKTRQVITDTNIPLSGPNSVLGHSIVIEDKHAPKHRGNRMACTGIFRRFRYKGVVNHWMSSDKDNEVTGELEFIQETPFDITNSKVELNGLQGIASGYHVHKVPVLNDLAFPCASSTLYGHFNPLNITASPPPTEGTNDEYEIGDLSGKYGLLDGKVQHEGAYNDTNLPLFGLNSILGRSILIHKKEQSKRWVCGTIGWGYAPSEARQIAAIASFHHPKGYAWGYIRLRQLVYNDGSLSETSIEVNLRHPGSNNKNITRGHNWSIFVNPVGVDAAVKFFQSRCVAAGYRWNPFLIQLAFPNDRDYYDKQCTPEYPYRCDAGDVSGRLGPIDIGDKRRVFMDPNFPLAGEHSAMGKAIVIHNEKGRVENFACANILPDEDIVKWANIRRTGKFSAAIFMYDMRKMLNAPEWFLAIDYQTVKNSLDKQCVTFRIYFMGPYARQLEQDFSRLLAGGILEKPTIKIPGMYPDPKRDKKVSYRACGGFEDEDLEKFGEKGKKKWWDLSHLAPSAAPSLHSNESFLYLSLIFLLLSLSKFLFTK